MRVQSVGFSEKGRGAAHPGLLPGSFLPGSVLPKTGRDRRKSGGPFLAQSNMSFSLEVHCVELRLFRSHRFPHVTLSSISR